MAADGARSGLDVDVGPSATGSGVAGEASDAGLAVALDSDIGTGACAGCLTKNPAYPATASKMA